ncbi:MAG: YihY/virulence factor BrkB family protein [Vicinamibacteria bacterium]
MTTPEPRRPMTFKDIRMLVDKTVLAWVDDYAPSMGAAIAYYTLFSIAPLLILVIAVGGMVFGQEAAEGAISFQLRDRVGVQAAASVEQLLKSVSQPAEGVIASIIGVFTLVLGATSVFGELQSALNRIWRVPEPAGSNSLLTLLRTRLKSFLMVAIMSFLLLLSLAFGAVLSGVGELSHRWFEGRQSWLQVANSLLSFLISAFLFAIIYKVMPRARIAWRDVGVGAVVTAVLFELGKLLIGLYLGRSTVGSGFGAAGSLVVFLMWIYFSAQIFLLGAEFTWVFTHQRGSRSERFVTKVVRSVPSRSGETTAEAKAEHTMRGVEAYPLTTHYASKVGRKVKKHATKAGRYIQRKPLVGLGILAGVGLVVAAVAKLSDGERKVRPDRGPYPGDEPPSSDN